MFKRKIIIGIHGIGNKPPKPLLKKWWIKSINEGLKAIGYTGMSYNFELIYWADFIHPKPQNSKVKDKKKPLYIERPYTPAKYFPEKWEPSKIRKKILDHIEKGLDKIFLEQHIINFDSIADLIIRRLYSDIDIYYNQRYFKKPKSGFSAKDAIRQRLVKTLKKYKKREILLIAHSMGSVVAYDVLTQVVPDIRINTFMTMGSPLGLPVIMKKIFLEQDKDYTKEKNAAVPENIYRRWYNFSDLHDKIAVNYALDDDFRENSSGIKPVDEIVWNTYEYNGVKNPHKSFGYLRTREAAEAIHDFLTYRKVSFLESIIKKSKKFITNKINIIKEKHRRNKNDFKMET